MDFLSKIWPRNPPKSDIGHLYNILIAILPAFVALADHRLKEIPERDCKMLEFYLDFKTKIFNLYAIFCIWDLTEWVPDDPEDRYEIQEKLDRFLYELESRFLSRQVKVVNVAWADLKLEYKDNEKYPKANALVRILPDNDRISEDLVIGLARIIRVESVSSTKREKFLETLHVELVFFDNLLPAEAEPNPICPIKFSDYPSSHLRKLASTLFDVIQKNWQCQCHSGKFSVGRKTRWNLTEHQQFETAPAIGQDTSKSSKTSAIFRILFPVGNSPYKIEWQDTDISVEGRSYGGSGLDKVDYDFCRIIREVKPQTRPNMVVHGQNLWLLSAKIESNKSFCTQVQEDRFVSLKALLQSGQGSSNIRLSRTGGKDRLILSFILATSFMHFVRGPWLQSGLNSENICFLKSHPRSPPDITQPYLTTSCSSSTQRESPQELNRTHWEPDFLSFGILLLEIAQGASINFSEEYDRCATALDCMDEWIRLSKADRSKFVPDELRRAISACISPDEINNAAPGSFSKHAELRKYLFERILYPLELSLMAYGIHLNELDAHTTREPAVKGLGSFEHQLNIPQEWYRFTSQPNDTISLNRQTTNSVWRRNIQGVLALYNTCKKQIENIPPQDQKNTRVKIAVLDSGLQLQKSLQENYEQANRISVQQSKNFVEGEDMNEWRIDRVGHGSDVARIILSFTPAADLHIAKVFKTHDDLADSKLAIQVHERITEAIKLAAKEWKVDMIVMCFGFGKLIPSISDAIHTVHRSDKPPLFFAATQNDGANSSMAWPARSRDVIGVNSTNGDGASSSFNPSDKDVDPILYALGEDVPIESLFGNDNETRYVSGTSYATPVATAFAANLLGCVRMVISASTQKDQNTYRLLPTKLQRLDGMLLILKRHMQRKHHSGTKSLLPWDFLNVDMLKDNKILKDIAGTLEMG
ncbi:subtilase [Nemania sp. FL0916]|nr:subtilase [Nemania sp. FL0916]